jgi:ParB/RepB/Spo0J family partition protein
MPVRHSRSLPWFKKKTQVRHSEPALQEMAGSLREHGQLQDVAALADGTLIYGHRRLAAAPLAGLTELWVQVYEEPLTDAEIRVIQLVENVQRVDLSPYELAVAVRPLVEESGLEQKTVAARLGKSPAWVCRMMAVWNTLPAVQEAFRAGQLGITDVELMAKRSAEEQQAMLAARLDGGATRDDLVRRSRRRTTDTVRVSRVRFALPSQAVITVAADGLTLDAVLDALTEGAKAVRKGIAEAMDSKTFQQAMACKAKGR